MAWGLGIITSDCFIVEEIQPMLDLQVETETFYLHNYMKI